MSNAKILLVDDNIQYLEVYSQILRHHGHEVQSADNGKDALGILKKNDIDIIITDMVMPKIDGLELIRNIKQIKPDILVIVVTGEGTVSNAVEAMKSGAQSYLQKPLNVEELLLEIEKVAEIIRLKRLNESLRFQYETATKAMVGVSRFTEEIRNSIGQISQVDSNVLITGESGTGKEVVAGLIHESSKRNEYPMIRVNCSAFSEGVLESELFGHEKGAFTGADAMKKGRFELANGSTLFLDEIGELSAAAQVKLLRVIQEKCFERVGGTVSIKSNFRLIAATNRDLKAEILKGRFREDLFYRINIIPIHLAPLRERPEDIQILIRYFSLQFSQEMNKPPLEFSTQATGALLSYAWPGNIRELKNLVERLTVFSTGKPIQLNHLPSDVLENALIDRNSLSLRDVISKVERSFILERLTQNNWNISATANEIGIARKNLHLKIKQYDLIRSI